MKHLEWAKQNGFQNEEDERLYFSKNLSRGNFPVAIASCIKCDEILNDDYTCPICSKEKK